MKCVLCEKKATKIASLEINPVDGVIPSYARTGIIVVCEDHVNADAFLKKCVWNDLEYLW